MITYGDIKHIFSVLYNCLDKIAHLIRFYFFDNEKFNSDDIYFNGLTSKDFKRLIIEKNNYQLLALHNLSVDFQDGYSFFKIRKIRNMITHSYLNINEMLRDKDAVKDHEIFIDDYINETEKLFMIVKSAIQYIHIDLCQVEKKIDYFDSPSVVRSFHHLFRLHLMIRAL